MWHVTLAYFHCFMTLPHFLYPFSCWLTFRLFPFFAFTDPVAMNSFLQCPCACLALGVFLQDSDTQKSVVWGLGNYVLQIGNLWQNVNQLSLLIYLMFLILVRLSQWSKKCSFSLRGLVTNSLQLRYFAAGHCSRVCSPGAGVLGWRGCVSWASLEATELELCSSEIVSVYTPSVVSLSSSWLVSSLCQHLKSFSNV